MDWVQSAFHNLVTPNRPPSYRGVEMRRQSTVDRSMRPTLNPSHSLVLNKGLVNKPGDNNCFLNTAVQILWHNDIFRRSFRLFEEHTCDGEPCIFCALKVLFTQFQHSGQMTIPPNALRVAMSSSYENLHRFQLGLMDDAAECFEKILEQMHYNLTGTNDLDSCSTPCCISHQKFALATVEQTVCQCREQSEPHPFVEFVHYITTSQLVNCSLALKKEQQIRGNTFDLAVKHAGSSGEYLRCQGYPKCQKNAYIRRILLNSPDIICIGFIWDSDSPPLSFIMNVVEAIDTTIHPAKLFDRVSSDSMNNSEYQLTAMITYYGKHYSTFCYHTQQKQWVYFDDAKFRKAGSSWSGIVEECRKAHFQPLLLVYTNPQGTAIKAFKPSTTAATSQATRESSTTPTPVVSTVSPPPIPSATPSPPISSTTPSPQPTYMNVSHQGCNTGSSKSTDPNENITDEEPLYDEVRSTRPVMKKQSDVGDLIQFSLTPAVISTSISPPLTTPSAVSTAGKTTHPTAKPGIQDNPFVVHDIHAKPNVTVRPKLATPTAPKPVERNTSSQGTTTNSVSTSKLDTSIRGLPKNIRDAILHCGMCLQKIDNSQDPVVISALLDSAIGRIHGIVNHPSVTACPELHQHLKLKKEQLQRKLSGYNSELETARSNPLSLLAILSREESTSVNNSRKGLPSGTIQQCIECKSRRVCDERLLCGPCRLKLRLNHH